MRVPALICLFLAVADAAEVRSWTDIQDRRIEASLLRVEDQTVILKLNDGREIPYPLAKLSAEDRNYVEETRSRLTAEKPGGKTDDTGKTLNFDAPWPQLVKFSDDPEINTVEETAGEKRFIYESANYRYVCDVRLAKSVVKGFAVLFEATRLYCRSLPLAINGGAIMDGKLQEDFVKAWGRKGIDFAFAKE